MLDRSFVERLTNVIGKEHVHSDRVSLLSYSYDATPDYQSLPELVVEPGSTEEISEG
ncbi:hypothetical protein ACJROX_18270 [Pseudalkalibacillus sp. A8]|uniref:hypothetical protein n=1 Tax=Pseudalkalibacillus sp. A8 TaxID=3382641 RepID=UPI0038B622C8